MSFYEVVRRYHSDGEERHVAFYEREAAALAFVKDTLEHDTITDVVIFECRFGDGARTVNHTFKTQTRMVARCSCPACDAIVA